MGAGLAAPGCLQRLDQAANLHPLSWGLRRSARIRQDAMVFLIQCVEFAGRLVDRRPLYSSEASVAVRMRIDAGQLDLPELVPDEMVASIIAPINQTIDAGVESLTSLKEDQLASLRAQLTALANLLTDKVQFFHDAVAVGGSFQVEVQAYADRIKAMLYEATTAFSQWDGVLTFDVAGARAFLESTAVAARSQAAETVFNQEDPWPELVCRLAQPELDSWRERTEADVEAQYHPVVPDWEVDACVAVCQEAHQASTSTAFQKEMSRRQQRCGSYRGQQGREALYALWREEQALLQLVGTL